MPNLEGCGPWFSAKWHRYHGRCFEKLRTQYGYNHAGCCRVFAAFIVQVNTAM